MRRAAPLLENVDDEVRKSVQAWVDGAHSAFETQKELRADLLPSVRAIDDVLRMSVLHRTLELGELVPITTVLDHAMLGRFVASLSGPESEVGPLIAAWLPLADGLPLTKRRLEHLSLQSKTYGFASFWQ